MAARGVVAERREQPDQLQVHAGGGVATPPLPPVHPPPAQVEKYFTEKPVPYRGLSLPVPDARVSIVIPFRDRARTSAELPAEPPADRLPARRDRPGR